MRILVSGGGTGGHVTPILAVAHEIKNLQPDAEIIYVGERRGKFASLTEANSAIDSIYTIFAGKLRRYHGQSWVKYLLDLQTLWRNLRDSLYVFIGTIQAWRLLGKLQPDIIFLKGGYVGLPVGLAAAARKLPFITHDSDAIPGLTNRLVSRWALLHATGLPTEFYGYPKQKAHYVGVLVGSQFQPVSPNLQQSYRKELQLPNDGKVLLITGGSLGARRLNQAVARLVPKLLEQYQDLTIIHQVGKGNKAVYGDKDMPNRLVVLEFMEGMHRYTGAADVIITRAGANTLAELGIQGKACIVVPNPQLTGGHQLENARYLLEHHAIVVVDEAGFNGQSSELQKAIDHLLAYPEVRAKLGRALMTLTKPNASHELAVLLLKAAKA